MPNATAITGSLPTTLPVVPTVTSTESRGPLAEDTSLRVRNVWMQGATTSTERAVLGDMVRLADRYDFQLAVQVHRSRATGALLAELAQRAGLPADRVRERVRLHGCDAKPAGWMEDSGVLLHVGRDAVEVLTMAPMIDYDQADYLSGFLSSDGYRRWSDASPMMRATNAAESALTAELARRLGHSTRQAVTYLEGGNVLSGSRADGTPFVIVGTDSVAISARMFLRSFTEEELAAEQTRLAAAGRLGDQEVADMAQHMAHANNHLYPGWKTTLDERDLPPARRFIALHSLVEKKIAADLRVNHEHCVFIPQLDLHIDMQLRPLDDGRILVNHPRECLRAIDEALTDPALPAWQRAELKEMRAIENENHAVRCATFDRAIEQLRAAGLEPIPVAGVFHSSFRTANFMNAVAVTTRGDESLYITNGSTLTCLSEAFGRHVRELGVDHFELIGADGGGPNKRCAAEILLGDGRTGGGIDCRELHF